MTHAPAELVDRYSLFSDEECEAALSLVTITTLPEGLTAALSEAPTFSLDACSAAAATLG